LRLAVTILVAVALACVVGFVVWLLTYNSVMVDAPGDPFGDSPTAR
jgi:hypothetical protein